MKLFIAILITLFFIGSIITFCVGIKKMKGHIKECEEVIERCTNEYANDPTDNNWLTFGTRAVNPKRKLAD